MATVFFVGELGPSHRDLPPLLAMARRFHAQRHRVVLILRDVMGATYALRNQEEFAVLQAPVWRDGKPKRDTVSLASYGDFLGNVGMDDVDVIGRVVARWQAIMDSTPPDLIVAHNSPGVCLAARGRVPVIAVGDGFSVPPADIESFPNLIAGRQPSFDQQGLLGNVNTVLARNRCPKLRSLPALFFTAGRFPLVLPDLDPYRGWRNQPARGPLDALPDAVSRPTNASAYVSLQTEFYEADAVLTALGEKGLPATALLRGISSDFLAGLQWPGVEVLETAPDPTQAVTAASLVVHSGTVELTTICAAIGRPQLIFPSNAENAVTATRAAELRIAKVAQGDPTPERIVGLLGVTERLAGHAETVAANLERKPTGALEAVMDKGLQLLSVPA